MSIIWRKNKNSLNVNGEGANNINARVVAAFELGISMALIDFYK